MNRILLTAPLLLTLAACGSAEEPAARADPPRAGATATASAQWPKPMVAEEKRVVVEADSSSGKLSIDLPGGAGASIRVPPAVAERLSRESKVDIDGVGLFPGSRVTRMEAVSRDADGAKNSRVEIGFTSPATPDAVAQWFLAAFQEKGHKASRQGNRIEGTTGAGNRFALDLSPRAQGSSGRLILQDEKAAGA